MKKKITLIAFILIALSSANTYASCDCKEIKRTVSGGSQTADQIKVCNTQKACDSSSSSEKSKLASKKTFRMTVSGGSASAQYLEFKSR